MTTENLERAFADTRAVMANVKADQLGDATPCASWTVKDLLDHIIGGSYHFGACVTQGKAPEGEMNVPWTADNMVTVYDTGAKESVAAFNAPGAMAKTVEMPFGALPAPAWLQIATTDTFMHAWDLAKATGQPTDIDPELAAQLLEGAKSFIQPGFRGADGVMPFGAEQSAPTGASSADQLAAFLGRTV